MPKKSGGGGKGGSKGGAAKGEQFSTCGKRQLTSSVLFRWWG